jgi:hypothetical protein
MPPRQSQDASLKTKRIQDHAKVLKFLMNTDNLRDYATGKLESPQKLIIFFAGYIAMRRIWEVATDHGRTSTGDGMLDMKKTDPNSIIYRIETEVAHPLGLQTSTLFRITTFRYWGRRFLRLCET